MRKKFEYAEVLAVLHKIHAQRDECYAEAKSVMDPQGKYALSHSYEQAQERRDYLDAKAKGFDCAAATVGVLLMAYAPKKGKKSEQEPTPDSAS